jgi:DNA recombination protein RmuC
MSISFIIQFIILVLVLIQFIFIIVLLNKNKQDSQRQILNKLLEYDNRLDKNETSIRNDLEVKFGQNRSELTTSLMKVSENLSSTITQFIRIVDTKIQSIQESIASSSKINRDELASSLRMFEEKSSLKIESLTRETKEGLEKNRSAVEKKLSEIQEGNEKKLEKMRETVDEKLQKTLEARLGASFKQVSEQLELVNKSVGEMQNLAADVGDLKKVMTNVKTKGVLGEYQLGAILEEILHPNQYDKNVKTKNGSNDIVEFAVKIPNRENPDKTVWLPIDSKLPANAYETLVDAYESADKKAVDDALKIFARTVKNFAKDIYDKYIDPPGTTEFAIMFLPFEGEYAEVVRNPGLLESIRREYKIIVTGPSTLAALLNALRVGFNSIAVDKNTGLIRELLSGIKKEFGNFEKVLVKVKDQIDTASNTLAKDVGVRTRAINKALNKVESVPDDSAGQKLITDAAFDSDDTN